MSIFQDADFAGEPGELDAREDPALDNGDDDDQEDGEEECDGENDDEIEPVENGPESFPDTEIDGEASEVDGDDEVEMSDLDPYRNQPNNQLGFRWLPVPPISEWRTCSYTCSWWEGGRRGYPSFAESCASQTGRLAIIIFIKVIPRRQWDCRIVSYYFKYHWYIVGLLWNMVLVLFAAGADDSVARVNAEMDAIIAEIKRLMSYFLNFHMHLYTFVSVN